MIVKKMIAVTCRMEDTYGKDRICPYKKSYLLGAGCC